jgi:SNF2 family DNA or RNA helicase
MEFHYDERRKLLIYELARFGAGPSSVIEQRIPEARAINGRYIAVPMTLQNVQTLRWLGYPVASLMTDTTYDWPRPPGVTPYESQKLTANFLVTHPRCFNLSDMGTGKTNSILWAADWLMRQHAPGTFRALIVCPLSIMERVWADAIFKNFLGKRTFAILHGTAEQRLKALSMEVDFYVCNFDGVGVGAHTRKRFELDGFSKALSERLDIRLCIADEASAYKDSQTKRHRLARLIIGRRDYLWLATGTPTPQYPTDAYGLAKLVNNAWGKSFTTFRAETMYKATQFKWVALRDGYDKARKLLQPSIRIDISEVWDAPPLTTQVREVPLTAEQKKHMADLKRDLIVTLKSGKPITTVNEAGARQKFMQISAGAIYDGEHFSHAIDAEPRLAEIENVIGETTHKVVIFVGLTSIVNLLYKRLSKRWPCAIINGAVPARERADVIRRFGLVDDPLRVVICDPQATAHGINEMVTADTCIWATPTDKTELYLQGIKRICRPGQKYPMTVVQIVSNKLEQEIFRRLEHNETMQGALLDAVRKGDL